MTGSAAELQMDWLSALIRLVEALALPVAAVIIVLLFRREFRQLVPLVRKLKAGPLEAEFEREIREISEEAGEATTPEGEVKLDQRLIDLAKMYPRTAIIEAWRSIEVAVLRAAHQQVISSPMPDVSTPLKAMRELARVEAVSPEDAALFYRLQGLRNQAVHVMNFDPDPAAALAFVELATQLEARLKKLAEPR